MTETPDKPKIDLQTILDQYVATENGVVFHVLQSAKNPHICHLRRKNRHIKTDLTKVRQKLVDGKYKAINEHQLKQFLKEDNAFIAEFSQKMLKRTVLAQLLIELDDDLIQDFGDDKRMKSVLTKSNNEVERVATKMYDQVYGTEENIAQEVMNELDGFTSDIGAMPLEHLLVVRKIVKEYKKDPVKFVEHFNKAE